MTDAKLNFLAQLSQTYGSLENAALELEKIISRRPGEVGHRLDLQVVLNTLGREEESFAISNELIEIAPNDARVLFNRGWHILRRGDLQKGLALLEFGRGLRSYGRPPLASRQALWMPERGRGQRVHLMLEGGLGDELIHFRFAKTLSEEYGCKVSVICHLSLASLIARQKWVSAVLQVEAALGVYHDSWLPAMSAAFALGMEFKDLPRSPYLEADPVRVKFWRSKTDRMADGKLKVGIRWAGNPDFEHQQFRLFPPEILTSLGENPSVQIFSFQRDNNLLDLPNHIVDLAPDLREWDDTAAALMNMDLMISSCTSVAHLSAALGRPTWVITPALPYFIWAPPGETSPWYETARVFRQAKFGSWKNVESEVRGALNEFIFARRKT